MNLTTRLPSLQDYASITAALANITDGIARDAAPHTIHGAIATCDWGLLETCPRAGRQIITFNLELVHAYHHLTAALFGYAREDEDEIVHNLRGLHTVLTALRDRYREGA